VVVVGLQSRHGFSLINYIYRVTYPIIIKYSSISNMIIILFSHDVEDNTMIGIKVAYLICFFLLQPGIFLWQNMPEHHSGSSFLERHKPEWHSGTCFFRKIALATAHLCHLLCELFLILFHSFRSHLVICLHCQFWTMHRGPPDLLLHWAQKILIITVLTEISKYKKVYYSV
jgi:hypothetical protein